jgi:hypothetical protein
MYTASALPDRDPGVEDDDAHSGRALTFRECLRSGDETQTNRR